MQSEFVHITGNAAPDHASCGVTITADGMPLRYGMFAPSGPARGTVLLLQGRCECLERHFETIRDFNARGLHVLSFDWRGQGGSPPAGKPGRYGHVGSFKHYERDVEHVVQQLMLPDCPPPYFVCGNSMGAHIGLHIISKHNWFEAALMVAPLVEPGRPHMPRWIKLAVVGVMTVLGMGRLKTPFYRNGLPDEQGFAKNLLTSDKTRFVRNVRIWQQAPLLAAIAPTAGWVFAAMRSCSTLQNRDPLTPLTCPALLFIAGSDQVVSNEAIREFARNAPGAAIVVINGALHDLLSEADIYRDQFFAALDAFLADRLRDVPAG